MTLRHVLQTIVFYESAIIFFGLAVLLFEHLREIRRGRQADSVQFVLIDVALMSGAMAAMVYVAEDVAAAAALMLPLFAVSCTSTVTFLWLRRHAIRQRRAPYRRRNLQAELRRGKLDRRRDDTVIWR